MAIHQLPVRTDALAAQLHDWGAVGAPLSTPACQLRAFMRTSAKSASCSP